MFRGYWVAAVALGLIFSSASSSAQEQITESPIEPDTRQEETAEQPSVPAQSVVPAIVPTEPTRAKHDESSSDHGGEDSGQDAYLVFGDGIAQWVMAATGVAAFLLSGWAVWLLYLTLKATRKMVCEAERATIAAEATVIETRRIGEAQARSYLNITKASFTATNGTLDAFLHIKNSGPTPAVGLTADCDLMTYDDWDGSSPWEPVSCQIDFGVAQVVGANDVEVLGIKWRNTEGGSNGFDRVVARHPKCIIKIDITWTDVFKKKQTSRFILNALPAGGAQSIPRPYRGSFRVQYVLTSDQN